MDRSVRLGDMVTVDGRYGAVSKVTSRYVVVRSLDGVDAIVPNETLVTTTVLNHSYSTRNVRLAVQVQISYDSDVDRALALMEEAGRSHDRVLKAPDPPTAFLSSFADNGMVLELGVLDRRSREGPAQLEKRDQPRDSQGVRDKRHPTAVSAARSANHRHASVVRPCRETGGADRDIAAIARATGGTETCVITALNRPNRGSTRLSKRLIEVISGRHEVAYNAARWNLTRRDG
jgi:hypothetical protein